MVARSLTSIAAVATLICVASVTVARAEGVACAPLASIAKALAEGKYHEAPIVHAIASSGAMLIVFAAADGATWTLVGIRPDRPEMGCPLGSGTDWQAAKPAPPGRPS